LDFCDTFCVAGGAFGRPLKGSTLTGASPGENMWGGHMARVYNGQIPWSVVRGNPPPPQNEAENISAIGCPTKATTLLCSLYFANWQVEL